jgi:hypothetical protein
MARVGGVGAGNRIDYQGGVRPHPLRCDACSFQPYLLLDSDHQGQPAGYIAWLQRTQQLEEDQTADPVVHCFAHQPVRVSGRLKGALPDDLIADADAQCLDLLPGLETEVDVQIVDLGD